MACEFLKRRYFNLKRKARGEKRSEAKPEAAVDSRSVAMLVEKLRIFGLLREF